MVQQGFWRYTNCIVSGLLVLDEVTLNWNNVSTIGLNSFATIGEGYMNIVEAVGEKGILVAFGGYTIDIGSRLTPLASAQTEAIFQVRRKILPFVHFPLLNC